MGWGGGGGEEGEAWRGGTCPQPPPRSAYGWLLVKLNCRWHGLKFWLSNNYFDEFCLVYNIKVASETAAPKYEYSRNQTSLELDKRHVHCTYYMCPAYISIRVLILVTIAMHCVNGLFLTKILNLIVTLTCELLSGLCFCAWLTVGPYIDVVCVISAAWPNLSAVNDVIDVKWSVLVLAQYCLGPWAFHHFMGYNFDDCWPWVVMWSDQFRGSLTVRGDVKWSV